MFDRSSRLTLLVGAILTSTSAAAQEVAVWTASPSPLLRVGALAGPEAQLFVQVADAASLPDGGVAVLDGRARELRIFDEAGASVATAGGPGEGPGEMRSPFGLERIGDELVVWDPGRSVVGRWDLDGRFLGEERLEDHPIYHEGALLSDGSRVIPRYGATRGRSNAGNYRIPADLIWYQADTVIDLGDFPYVEMYSADGQAPHGVPFGGASLVAAGGSPLRLFIGDKQSDRVREIDQNGETVRTVRLLDDRERITPSIWDSWTEARTENMVDPQRFRRAFSEMSRPDSTEWTDALVVDSRGRLWSLSWSLDEDLTAVVYEDGVPVARVDLPEVAEVFEITDEVIVASSIDPTYGVHSVEIFSYFSH